jgi:hypothetical protein
MKLKIDNDTLIDGFFEYARLIGIVAPIKDYRFCWYLNKILHLNFRVNNNIEIELNKKKRQYFFSVFEYTERGTTKTHYLYNNQFDGEYLLPEFKHLDFLWLIKDENMRDEELPYLLSSIRVIPSVQLITEMTNEKMKNKQNLIF